MEFGRRFGAMSLVVLIVVAIGWGAGLDGARPAEAGAGATKVALASFGGGTIEGLLGGRGVGGDFGLGFGGRVAGGVYGGSAGVREFGV